MPPGTSTTTTLHASTAPPSDEHAATGESSKAVVVAPAAQHADPGAGMQAFGVTLVIVLLIALVARGLRGPRPLREDPIPPPRVPVPLPPEPPRKLSRAEREAKWLNRLDTLEDGMGKLAATLQTARRREIELLAGVLGELAPNVLSSIRLPDDDDFLDVVASRRFEGATEDYDDTAPVLLLGDADNRDGDGQRDRIAASPVALTDKERERARQLRALPATRAPLMLDRPYVALRPEVLRTILEECRCHPRVETGGILLGRRERWGDHESIDLQGHIGPGDNVSRHVAMFRGVGGDAAVNTYLWYYYTHPGTEYVGEWHKHPSGFTQPSSGDLATVRDRMLPKEPRLLIPIVAAPLGKAWDEFEIRFYYITRDKPEFIELPARLLRTPTPLPADPPSSASTNLTWRERVPDRFRIERVLLERLGTFAADPDEDDPGALWVHVAPEGAPPLTLLTPSGYPSKPPALFALDESGAPHGVDLESLLGRKWEPRYYLIHIVAAWREAHAAAEPASSATTATAEQTG